MPAHADRTGPRSAEQSSDPRDTTKAVSNTDLRLPGRRQGKVRDTYTLPNAAPNTAPNAAPNAAPTAAPDGGDAIAMIATDRLSAFDVVLPTPIPGKGRLLTEIAAFWLALIERAGLGPTHLIAADDAPIPDHALTTATTRADLRGRVTIGRKCVVIPVECVVRGYLEGSGWHDYQRTGYVCAVPLPPGLRRCEQLPEPIFTPATKAQAGHDENIGFDAACAHAQDELGIPDGRKLLERLRERSLAIYAMASRHAAQRGIILADTKFEFGLPIVRGRMDPHAEPVLIDEALTPDSSRFWPADGYQPGTPQPSFDKQFVREYLERLVQAGAWDKSPPGPVLPPEVVAGTLARYRAARDRLLG